MEINNIKIDFLNDIFLSGESFTNLYLENKFIVDGNSTESIFSTILFKENNISDGLKINGLPYSEYLNSDVVPLVQIFSAPDINTPPYDEDIYDKRQHCFDYVIEHDGSLDSEIEAFVIVSTKDIIDFNIVGSDEIPSPYFSYDEVSPTEPYKLSINENIYDTIVTSLGEIYSDSDENKTKYTSGVFNTVVGDNEITIIPIKIKVNSITELDVDSIGGVNGFKYDDNSSKGLLRTNPKLTGNVKLSVNNEGIWFNSFDANDILATSRYKRYKLDSNSNYQYDLKKYFEGTPKEIIYGVKEHIHDEISDNVNEQYNTFYSSGCEPLLSKMYSEKMSYFSPLYLGNNVPSYFMILTIDNYETKDYTNLTLQELLKKGRIVKNFSLKNDSKLGKYIRNYKNNSTFSEYDIDVKFQNYELTKWRGGDLQTGVVTNKGEYLHNYIEDNSFNQYELENYITEGFERSGLISQRILNLEYIFDDSYSDYHSVNSYFGFYVDENELTYLDVDLEELGIKDSTNIYTTNNLLLENDTLVVNNILNFSDGVDDIMLTVNGIDDYKLKVNNIKTNSENERLRFDVKVNHEEVNLSSLYSLTDTKKQFKAERIEYDTKAYSLLDFEGTEINKKLNFQINLDILDKSYILYATPDIPINEAIDYLSYDKLVDVYYGSFSYVGVTNNILTALTQCLNVIDNIDAQLIGDKILITEKNAGGELNNSIINLFYNEHINYSTPTQELTMLGGAVMGKQIKVHKDDVDNIDGTELFRTINGFSKLTNFSGVFKTLYIEDLTGGHFILTIDEDKFRFSESGDVSAVYEVNPSLSVVSFYPIADLDFSLVNTGYEQPIKSELGVIDTLNKYYPISDRKPLLYNSLYKFNVISGSEIDSELNGRVLYQQYYNLEGSNIGETPDLKIVNISIQLPSGVVNGDISKIELYVSDSESYIVDYILDGSDPNNLTTLVLRLDGDYYDLYKSDTTPIKFFNLFAPITREELEQVVNDTYYIENNGEEIKFNDGEILFETNTNNSLLIIYNTINKFFFIEEHEKIDYSIDHFYEIESLFISKNEKLLTSLENKDSIFSDNQEYSDITDSKIIPTTNKWEYLNSSDISDSSYKLNFNDKFGSIGYSPDYSSETYSMNKNSFQWFLLNNTLNESYVNVDVDPYKLKDITNDYFIEYFTKGNHNTVDDTYINKRYYSYIISERGKYTTIFKGVKYQVDSESDLSGYKFTIVLKAVNDKNKQVSNEVIVNDKFKNITIIISVSFTDYFMKTYGLQYSFLYNIQDKYKFIKYMNYENGDINLYDIINLSDIITPYGDDVLKEINGVENNTNYKIFGLKFQNISTLKYILENYTDDKSIEYQNLSYMYKFTESEEYFHMVNWNRIMNNKGGMFQTTSNNLFENYMYLPTDSKYFNFNVFNFKMTQFISASSNSEILPLALYTPDKIYAYLHRGGRNYFTNYLDNLQINKNEFSTDNINIKPIEPKNVTHDGVEYYRYDGLYIPKTNNIIKFNNKHNRIKIDNEVINLPFKNIEFKKDEKTYLSEYYFNKITNEPITEFTDYHDHLVYKSSYHNGYYKLYNTNTDSENIHNEKLNKNFFNSLIFNLKASYDIIPLNVSYEIVNENIECVVDIKDEIQEYFDDKVYFDVINKSEFINLNVYGSLILDKILVTSENNTTGNFNTINQEINIINGLETYVDFVIDGDKTRFKVEIDNRIYKNYKIELIFKHI